MTAVYDAIIVGGGVAGGTAAILLAQAGWSVALVEKRPFPRRKVCGECIAAPNIALLDALGVGREFEELAGPPLTRVGLCVGDEVFRSELPSLAGPGARWGRALAREHLDTLLLVRAARLGVTIRQPCTVKRLERPGALYECQLAADRGDLEQIEAPVLIGAHGSWEPQPWLPSAERAARGPDLFAFKATFSGSGLEPGLLPVLAFPGGYGGMVIGDGGRLTLACCVRRDALRDWRAGAPPAAAGEAVQAALEARCRGVRMALAGADREGAWLAVGPVRPGVRAAWSARAGFAVGNAAGEAHPVLGEGISMAIQSAWVLCGLLTRERNALLRGAGEAFVAQSYAREWRRRFGARVRFAAVLAQLAMHPKQARPLLPLLRAAPGLLTLAARLGGKARPLGAPGTRPAWTHTMVAAAAPRVRGNDP
jgi:2-polyprenyl-6-methoxyphenol hydroxylase-like FAD-dependent oxidoreductase